MDTNRKSVFARIRKYVGNPIDGYNKINNFLDKSCYYSNSIYSFLFANFKSCVLLRGNYVDLEDCLNSINNLFMPYCDAIYDFLDENTKNNLFAGFLDYCEIIVYVYLVTCENIKKTSLWRNVNFDRELFDQLLDLIKNNLNSMNHGIKCIDTDTYEVLVFNKNPEAECVADQSSDNLKEAIYRYLGCKDNDIESKEESLHKIIDLLEPLLKAFSNECGVVSKIKEYVQLLRHPEIKKEEAAYKWFYEDKQKFLDQLFMLCIFIKEYDISKQTIGLFEKLKKEENS